ncbi:MAG: hypothetical protein ABSH28_14835, partial [Acidobacteriota bacterium]
MSLSVHRHRLYGLSIESPFPLPCAPAVSAFDQPPDITVLWEPETAWDARCWRVTLTASSREYPDIGADSDGSACLAWSDELRFVINPGRDQIRIISRVAKLEFAPTVLVGYVLGYVLYLRGVLCLHGSVLERGGRAIAVLGEHGAGKSTIAAALVQRGALLLSDDLVVIPRTERGVFVEPGCAGMRLESAAVAQLLGSEAGLARVPYLNKLLWDFSGRMDTSDQRFCLRATPLDALYVLETSADDDGVNVGPPLSQSAAL